MGLRPGDTLGAYKIVALLGKGGMGEVYRATDMRLHRDVAIKVSAERFSERFAQEARAVAALNHPNICTVYDVGPDYLVMEYIDGTPVGHTPDVRKLLDLAAQIADGMAAAHAAGFIHRDLKPENILVTRDGRAKILDFGLAKRAAGPNCENDPAVTLTDPGTTVGTVAYMSPEQARGEQTLGPQSDQFSFGLMLYEMAAGRRAFRRGSAAETMAAIIREAPEPLPPETPPPLRWLIGRLLEKDPADRYDSTRDLYRELRQMRERLSESATAASTVPVLPSRRRRLWRIALAVIGLAAGAGLAWTLLPRKPANGIAGYKFTPILNELGAVFDPAWSPDGKSIAYRAIVRGRSQIMVRPLGGRSRLQLTAGKEYASEPFWSPDGKFVYFLAGGSLWAVGAAGGAPEEVLPDVVSSVLSGGSGAAVHPDGKTFAFQRGGKLWVGRDPRSGAEPPREFGKAPYEGTGLVEGFAPDGSKLAVMKGRDLWVLDYPSGEARRFAFGTASRMSWMPDSRRAVVAADADASSLWLLDTVTARRSKIVASPTPVIGPSVSPDGKRLLFTSGTFSWDLMEVEMASGRVRRFEVSGPVARFPAWAPSGAHLSFVALRPEASTIDDVPIGDQPGGFSRTLFTTGRDAELRGLRWSPDGSRLLFDMLERARTRTMVLNASGGLALAIDDKAEESSDAVWSQDGRWVAYRRRAGQDWQLVKTQPGSAVEPVVLQTWASGDKDKDRRPRGWSAEWILADAGTAGLYLISSDGKRERRLSPRPLDARAAALFSGDGRQVWMLLRPDADGPGGWQLVTIDIHAGIERRVSDVDLPLDITGFAGISLHPDGRRFVASVPSFHYGIYMLEGFDK